MKKRLTDRIEKTARAIMSERCASFQRARCSLFSLDRSTSRFYYFFVERRWLACPYRGREFMIANCACLDRLFVCVRSKFSFYQFSIMGKFVRYSAVRNEDGDLLENPAPYRTRNHE